MADINTVTISGRLTRDPERKDTQTGISMANFTVACNRRKFKDQDEAEADFLRCVAWRNTADYVLNYLHKGDKVGVQGRIQTRSYVGDDGKTVYVTEIVASDVHMLSSSQKQEQNTGSYGAGGYVPPVGTGKLKEPEYVQAQMNIGTRMRSDTRYLDEMQPQDLSSDDLPF